MPDMINLDEAKAHFSRLVDRVEAGEELVIARAGQPVARLVPYQEAREPRTPGRLKGQIRLTDDWDSPAVNAEIAARFEG